MKDLNKKIADIISYDLSKITIRKGKSTYTLYISVLMYNERGYPHKIMNLMK